MASFNLAPAIQGTWLIPGGNTPANGGQLFFYVDGSTTKQNVYKDSAGNTAWSNPIVLDSGGNLPNGGEVWFTAGVTYKVVFAPSNDTDPPASPYRTLPSLAGINDITSAVTEWVSGPTPTFVSGSQFTLVGDQTSTFTKARRLKFTVTAGTVYGAISSVSFAAGTTTVNVAFASGALDSGLTAVSYSLIDPNNPSVDSDYSDKQASTVASAANGTTNIWGVDGNSLHITGTNPINSFSTTPYAGAIRELIFDGALSLNHNASTLAMPGNTNVTTAAGDSARVYADAGSTKVLSFTKAAAGVGGNSLVFLASSAAASSASLDFTNLNGYAGYLAVLSNLVPQTDQNDLWLRASTSNAASFDAAGNYNFAGNLTIAATGNIANVSSNAVSITLTGVQGQVSTSATFGVSGTININAISTQVMETVSMMSLRTTSSAHGLMSMAGFYNKTPNALRFMFQNGNIATGVITMYGIRSP